MAAQHKRLARRRIVSATAIGLYPPFYFFRAVREAPTSQGAIHVGNSRQSDYS